MASPETPYARYGPYILLKKLEESALTQTWRAGRLVNHNIEDTVTLLRFHHGDIEGLAHTMKETAAPKPTSEAVIVEGHHYEVVGFDPVITWDYTGGRSLRHLLQVAAGDEIGNPPNPVPVDQALAMTERLAHGLEVTARTGERKPHGALIPSLIWIDEDGSIRLLGHGLHDGILRSLADPEVRASIEGYFAPELIETGEVTAATEVYSLGAVLLAMLTSRDPGRDPLPELDSLHAAATSEAIPQDIASILKRCLASDPAERFSSPEEMRKALGKLTHGGAYAPTTFNLAFYLHSVFRDEIDREASERSAEQGLDPRLVPPFKATTPRPLPGLQRERDQSAAVPFAAHAEAGETSRNRLPMIIAAAVVLIALAAGAGWYFMAGPGAARAQEPAAPAETIAETSPAPEPIDTGLLAVTDTGETPADVQTTDTAAASDDEAKKQADAAREAMIREEIERRLRDELKNYQQELDKKLEAEKARFERERQQLEANQKPAPAAATTTTAPPKTPAQTSKANPGKSTAEELDRANLESSPGTTTAATTTVGTTTSQASQPAPAPLQSFPAAPAVREGDLVGFNELDVKPSFRQRADMEYPPIARRQKIEDTILVSVLISEKGEAIDAKIVKGESRRLGFNESAMRAIRGSTFNPGMKDGKRVKTWWVLPVSFRLSQ